MGVKYREELEVDIDVQLDSVLSAGGIICSDSMWSDLGPVPIDRDYISESTYNLDELEEGQIIAVYIEGDIRENLYRFDYKNKIEGKEYVLYPSYDRANIINIEYYNDFDWKTSIHAGRGINADQFSVYRVADEYLVEAMGIASELTLNNL